MEHNYSPKWKKRGDRTGLIRNALLKSMGYTDEDIEKPIIGIINTWAETNPGHVHFRQLSEAVKRGVWAAGGFPLEVNTLSICEVFFDTLLLCTLTGLMILCSVPDTSVFDSGLSLIRYTFMNSLGGFGGVTLFLLIFAFSYSTVICWFYYGAKSLSFIFGKSHNKIFAAVYMIAVLLGFVISDESVILINDYILLVMSVISLVTLKKNSERIITLSENIGFKKSKKSDSRKNPRAEGFEL